MTVLSEATGVEVRANAMLAESRVLDGIAKSITERIVTRQYPRVHIQG